MNSKVSIVIACYNDPFVVEAIRSALAQTYENKEIILIDDGSGEEVAKILRSLKKEVDQFLVQTNSGQSIARNNGIKVATGDYILNLDSDDYFEPEFCEKAIAAFSKNEELKIVTCKARRFNEKGTIDIFIPKGGSINDFLFSNSALGSSMFRKKDWEEVNGYEENLPVLGFEDWELYINILKNRGVALVLDEVLFNYRIRKNSTTVRIKSLKHEKFKHIIQKHRELYKRNFDGLLDHLFAKLENSENNIQKLRHKPEFRFGSFLIRPLRLIKSLFN